MAIATIQATLTLLDASGTAVVGADVIYRANPTTADDDGGGTEETAIYARAVTVQTNSSGIATFNVPVSSVVYVSVPDARIPETRLTAPDTGSTWEIGDEIKDQLPALPY